MGTNNRNMKAILEFNLPEDKQEFDFATQGSDWWNVCWTLDQELRSKMKYGNLSQNDYEIYEKIREELRGFIEEQGLDLDQ